MKNKINQITINVLLLIILFNIVYSQESSQNVRCSSVPFCQRLMFIQGSNIHLYYLDNKTIEIQEQIKIKTIFLKL